MESIKITDTIKTTRIGYIIEMDRCLNITEQLFNNDIELLEQGNLIIEIFNVLEEYFMSHKEFYYRTELYNSLVAKDLVNKVLNNLIVG